MKPTSIPTVEPRRLRPHWPGHFPRRDFRQLGKRALVEENAHVFHPENVTIANNVHVGHYAFLQGYKNDMRIGSSTGIGQFAFLPSAGDLTIGEGVGIGPDVEMLTHSHIETGRDTHIRDNDSEFKPTWTRWPREPRPA